MEACHVNTFAQFSTTQILEEASVGAPATRALCATSAGRRCCAAKASEYPPSGASWTAGAPVHKSHKRIVSASA